MVFKFKLVSDEATGFSREIEIDPDATFLDLRNAILDSVGYNKDNLSSFFICDDHWQKEQEITLEDMGTASDQDLYLMKDTPVSELIEEEGQRLIFTFDYLTERSFFMELQEIITGRHIMTPACVKKTGNPPVETVDLTEFEQTIDTKTSAGIDDFGDEFYGDTDYNEDELPEGFDDMTFN